MMKKESVSKNYFFQFAYQGLILVIPFILSPYLTRTLQTTALGTYTYVNSIAYYFVIFANLGIGVHGKRSISRQAGNELEQRKIFWSLFTLHAIISIIAIIAYILFVALFVKHNTIIYIIELFYIASTLFDITWLFYGLENFSSVVIKNTAIKVLECTLVFLLVKQPSDLWKYTLISAGCLFLGQIAMLPQAIKLLKPIRFGLSDIVVHIKPLLMFSVAVIATSLYTVFDKTLLGFITNVDNVAYYEYANKIVTIPKTFVEIASSVMFPRACQLIFQNNTEEHKKYVDYTFLITGFLGFGAIWGIISIATPFSTLFYGESFAVCGRIMIALSPLIYIVGGGKIMRSLFLIPYGMDKEFNLCIVYNAVINLILSIILIPVIGIYGAVVGTLVAELFGFINQIILCRKLADIRMMISTAIPFCGIGLIMFIVLRIISKIINAYSWIGLIETIIIGAVVYLLLSIIYMAVFRKETFSIIWKKIAKK